jgi:hypothetical protein
MAENAQGMVAGRRLRAGDFCAELSRFIIERLPKRRLFAAAQPL